MYITLIEWKTAVAIGNAGLRLDLVVLILSVFSRVVVWNELNKSPSSYSQNIPQKRHTQIHAYRIDATEMIKYTQTRSTFIMQHLFF